MIKIPDHLSNVVLDCIILHNAMDSDFNIFGDRWSILLCNEDMKNDPNNEVPTTIEKSIFLRLHNFECKERRFAVMVASAWLSENNVFYNKLLIHKIP